MEITLNQSDIRKLKPETLADILSVLLPQPETPVVEGPEGFDWDGVVNFTPQDIENFVSGCSEQTVDGLRVIARHGPVIHTSLLDTVGITNYGSFQGSCTKRARTISGDKNAYLLSWDDWEADEDGDSGNYAVSHITYQSLRTYFEL